MGAGEPAIHAILSARLLPMILPSIPVPAR